MEGVDAGRMKKKINERTVLGKAGPAKARTQKQRGERQELWKI